MLFEPMWEMALVQAVLGKEPAPVQLGTHECWDCQRAGICCEDGISQGFYYFTSIFKSLVPFKYEMTGEEIPLLNSLYHYYFG